MNRNFIDFIKLPESVRIPWFWGVWHRLTTRLDNAAILKEKLPANPLNTSPRAETVIVSLTSFPKRIDCVHLSIKSLMRQTYKPDRIILWLAEEQFPDKQLPETLKELERYGLEIRYCEHNLFGHKKYFVPLIEQTENEVVVTYDDDIIYHPNSLKLLMQAHKRFPKSIICNRAQVYTLNPDGTVANPGRWKVLSDEGVNKPSHRLCPSTGGGCLYPFGALCSDAHDPKAIQTALRGDDLWIMFMAAQNGTPFAKSRKLHRPYTVIADSQGEQLATTNIIGNDYIDILENLKQKYPDAWQRISTDKEV